MAKNRKGHSDGLINHYEKLADELDHEPAKKWLEKNGYRTKDEYSPDDDDESRVGKFANAIMNLFGGL